MDMETEMALVSIEKKRGLSNAFQILLVSCCRCESYMQSQRKAVLDIYTQTTDSVHRGVDRFAQQ